MYTWCNRQCTYTYSVDFKVIIHIYKYGNIASILVQYICIYMCVLVCMQYYIIATLDSSGNSILYITCKHACSGMHCYKTLINKNF